MCRPAFSSKFSMSPLGAPDLRLSVPARLPSLTLSSLVLISLAAHPLVHLLVLLPSSTLLSLDCLHPFFVSLGSCLMTSLLPSFSAWCRAVRSAFTLYFPGLRAAFSGRWLIQPLRYSVTSADLSPRGPTCARPSSPLRCSSNSPQTARVNALWSQPCCA